MATSWRRHYARGHTSSRYRTEEHRFWNKARNIRRSNGEESFVLWFIAQLPGLYARAAARAAAAEAAAQEARLRAQAQRAQDTRRLLYLAGKVPSLYDWPSSFRSRDEIHDMVRAPRTFAGYFKAHCAVCGFVEYYAVESAQPAPKRKRRNGREDLNNMRRRDYYLGRARGRQAYRRPRPERPAQRPTLFAARAALYADTDWAFE